MPDLPHPPAEGQGRDLSTALRRLDRLLEAARDLADAWHPALDHAMYPGDLPDFRRFVNDLDAWREGVASGAPPDRPIAALDFRNPEAFRVWLHALRDDLDDAIAAGEDATRAPAHRDLGRRMARRLLLDAHASLRDLVASAERGLDAAA
jgi:hypothetical protein